MADGPADRPTCRSWCVVGDQRGRRPVNRAFREVVDRRRSADERALRMACTCFEEQHEFTGALTSRANRLEASSPCSLDHGLECIELHHMCRQTGGELW